MTDINGFSQQMKEYFNSMPPFVQETIMQSSAKIETLDELKRIEKEITRSKND